MNAWIDSLAAWLGTTRTHEFMQTRDWAVPTVQTVHILAIAVVFSSSFVLCLRLLRVAGQDWSPAQWGARLNGWIGWGLVVLLLSGILMICGEPERSLNNAMFRAKMLMLFVALGLLVALARRARGLDAVATPVPWDAKLVSVALMAVWLAIIVCGRWIAYT